MKIPKLFFRTNRFSEQKRDFISELPLEMSHLILRNLDPESLLRAAQVSRSWMKVCQSDPCLRNTAKEYKDTKKLLSEKAKKKVDFVESDILDPEEIKIKMKQLNDYHNSFNYTQCESVYTIVCRINESSNRNNLNYIDEYSSLRFC
jgi:hypothetical protein